MNLKTFIDRPILSLVISIFITMVGVIGLSVLPVEQYPDIAPPTIRVSTTYSGANATAVQNSVIVPLEEAINGVENMTYMTSDASNTGSASISVYFKQGSQRTEPRIQGPVPSSCRSDQSRRRDDEATEQYTESFRSCQP